MGQIEGLGEVREGWILAFISSVTLNSLYKFSRCQFPQLLSGDDDATYFVEPFRELNEWCLDTQKELSKCKHPLLPFCPVYIIFFNTLVFLRLVCVL